jgi:hypothetical protein
MNPEYCNLQLRELMLIAERNKPVYDDFVLFCTQYGFESLEDWFYSTDTERAVDFLDAYLRRQLPEGVVLYDGVGLAYREPHAKWLFLGWIVRDAPEQRLRPLLKSVPATDARRKKAILIDQARSYIAGFLPRDRHSWPFFSDFMRGRLEGSRRSKQGTGFEDIVRELLRDIFERESLDLKVADGPFKLEGQTFDVSVTGRMGRMLMPVKTRNTSGGGHASIFSRDIDGPIRIANAAGHDCLPLIVAKAWAADIEALHWPRFVRIDRSPTEIRDDPELLRQALLAHLDLFHRIA